MSVTPPLVPSRPPIVPIELRAQLAAAQAAGSRIVLATGVFDLLHQEHRRFLNLAKAAGDVLVVAIESDRRVRQLKGEGRPVQPQAQRLEQVRQLPAVNWAFILPEEFGLPVHHRQLIAEIQPQILAVSSHSEHLERKRAILAEFGGKVQVVHQHNPAVSTSQILAAAAAK